MNEPIPLRLIVSDVSRRNPGRRPWMPPFGGWTSSRFTAITITVLGLVLAAQSQSRKAFPSHWGTPPAIQTQDYVELPEGYGHGSSTLAKWISANLDNDRTATPTPADRARVVYANDFEKLEPGSLPEEFMALNGEFLVKSDGTNKFLELPGSPLDSFALQFGPAEKDNVEVRARVFGTSKGRRSPTFGVGLGGVSGWKLQVSPGKAMLELLKDQDVKAAIPFEWQAGSWTQLRLRVGKVKEGEWRVEGKVWVRGANEPKEWMISRDVRDEPISGRASLLASPFAGTPIRFDDLVVERL